MDLRVFENEDQTILRELMPKILSGDTVTLPLPLPVTDNHKLAAFPLRSSLACTKLISQELCASDIVSPIPNDPVEPALYTKFTDHSIDDFMLPSASTYTDIFVNHAEYLCEKEMLPSFLQNSDPQDKHFELNEPPVFPDEVILSLIDIINPLIVPQEFEISFPLDEKPEFFDEPLMDLIFNFSDDKDYHISNIEEIENKQEEEVIVLAVDSVLNNEQMVPMKNDDGDIDLAKLLFPEDDEPDEVKLLPEKRKSGFVEELEFPVLKKSPAKIPVTFQGIQKIEWPSCQSPSIQRYIQSSLASKNIINEISFSEFDVISNKRIKNLILEPPPRNDVPSYTSIALQIGELDFNTVDISSFEKDGDLNWNPLINKAKFSLDEEFGNLDIVEDGVVGEINDDFLFKKVNVAKDHDEITERLFDYVDDGSVVSSAKDAVVVASSGGPKGKYFPNPAAPASFSVKSSIHDFLSLRGKTNLKFPISLTSDEVEQPIQIPEKTTLLVDRAATELPLIEPNQLIPKTTDKVYAVHKYIINSGFFKLKASNRKIVNLLVNEYNVGFIERDMDYHSVFNSFTNLSKIKSTEPDIIYDERTCIKFYSGGMQKMSQRSKNPFTHLFNDEYLDIDVDGVLVCLSGILEKFCRVVLVVELYDESDKTVELSPIYVKTLQLLHTCISKIVQHRSSVYESILKEACPPNMFAINLLYSTGIKDSSYIVRMIGDDISNGDLSSTPWQNDRKWSCKNWITEVESCDERFWNSFPYLNAFNSQALLMMIKGNGGNKGMCSEMSLDEFMDFFSGWICKDTLVRFYWDVQGCLT